ncbi:MAG: class I SAM-dependent methyltransferase [Planctomycetota bacterium]
MDFDLDRLQEFMNKAVSDMGAAVNASLVLIGDELGLYKAMNGAGPITSAELATKTGCDERYVREWLSAQAAGGYVTYDAKTTRFTLPPEQAMALAVDDSPAFVPGAYDIVASLFHDLQKLKDAFRSGRGVGWHEHHNCLFKGTERFFRPSYNANLIGSWLPSLDGVTRKLDAGAKVADVGCGHGASTILMAQSYPRSRFFGFDYHKESIEAARARAAKAGVADRVTFTVAPAKEFPGNDYDLVTCFDCLHDMGDPVGAARHVKQTLKKDGTWMVVEPFANDKLEDNLNPIGRVFYGASTMICTPASKSQEVGLALGAQAGEARLRKVVTEGGFGKFRVATSTPFNLVLEARP